jgi:predicted nucleotidyltransferase
LLDFSNRNELGYLADLVRAFQTEAGNVPYFLAGATARDLLLEFAYGINPGRDTRDLDLAVMVEDWAAFEQVRMALINAGLFTEIEGVLHTLKFKGQYELDLIPFGAIEFEDRTIAWPPNGDEVLDVLGFQEAHENTLAVRLPGDTSIQVVSLPGLMVLKLLAWKQRRLQRPGVDAHDLALILRYYLDAGNHERLQTEAAALVDAPDFDYEKTGAWLLGRDMASLLPESSRGRVADLLNTEIASSGPLRLVGDMPIEPDRALALLKGLTAGFIDNT